MLDRERPINIAVLAEGAITPLGNSADETWENFKAMKSGIVEHRYPPYTEPGSDERGRLIEPQIRAVTAGTIKNFDPIKALVETGFVPRTEVRDRLGSYAHYALAASFEALSKVKTADGKNLLILRPGIDDTMKKIERQRVYNWMLNPDLIHPLHFDTVVGTGFGGGQKAAEVWEKLKAGNIPDEDMLRSISDRASSANTQAYRGHGGTKAVTAACASSGAAELDAIRNIMLGWSQVALVVGTEGVLDKPIASAMFDALGTLDPGTDPSKVSRSLHRERNGFTMAEGAVAFVIADYDWAVQNKIPVLYRIIGAGETSGAEHNTDPNSIAQEQTLIMARRRAEKWHGPVEGKVLDSGHYTGTPKGEVSEVRATQSALIDLKDRLIMYASKRLTGHTLGAAGGVSQFVAGRALQEGIVPGMLFDGAAMDEANGWYIPRETHPEPELTDAVVKQFGFGDANVIVWLRKEA